MLIRVCAWCGRWLGLRLCWPWWQVSRSHGICKKCYDKQEVN